MANAGSARLSFDFHLSDLNPSRYLESWLPSNMLFDRFPVDLEVQIVNTGHAAAADVVTLLEQIEAAVEEDRETRLTTYSTQEDSEDTTKDKER